MPHVITGSCIGVKDQSCVDVCPTDCIHDAGSRLLIHPDGCIDGGACISACPVGAIFLDEDVPADQQDFIARNRAHFGL